MRPAPTRRDTKVLLSILTTNEFLSRRAYFTLACRKYKAVIRPVLVDLPTRPEKIKIYVRGWKPITCFRGPDRDLPDNVVPEGLHGKNSRTNEMATFNTFNTLNAFNRSLVGGLKLKSKHDAQYGDQ